MERQGLVMNHKKEKQYSNSLEVLAKSFSLGLIFNSSRSTYGLDQICCTDWIHLLRLRAGIEDPLPMVVHLCSPDPVLLSLAGASWRHVHVSGLHAIKELTPDRQTTRHVLLHLHIPNPPCVTISETGLLPPPLLPTSQAPEQCNPRNG